jgi:anti-sigma regulatory factor (Ser/Thr protein kinase)
MNDSVRIPVRDPSQVGEARRAAATITDRLGFDEVEAGKVAIIVTEGAKNLVKHAREGEILLSSIEQSSAVGVEILLLDKGPGMDIGRCMQDGFSTGGSPGTGLGAIQRLASFFDIYSNSQGTELLAQFWPRSSPPISDSQVEIGTINLPKIGESVCGDSWCMEQVSERQLFLVVDGLGHGPLASLAASESVRVFRDNLRLSTVQILQAIHAGIRSTRGAAIAIASIDFQKEEALFSGIGNIAGTILSSSGNRSMVSLNGTVGHQISKFQEFTYPFPKGSLLIMNSDGLTSRWNLESHSGILRHHSTIIAGALYRDFQRGRDDVTILVAREREEEAA